MFTWSTRADSSYFVSLCFKEIFEILSTLSSACSTVYWTLSSCMILRKNYFSLRPSCLQFILCDVTFLVCFTREHHEWLVSNSSWDGETGHPGHKGNVHTCQVLSTDVHFIDDVYLLSFVVNQNSAETSRRPLWDPQHEAKSRHAGDPQGSVWVWRPIRHSPAACEWSREEPAANPESRRGSCSHRRLCASR